MVRWTTRLSIQYCISIGSTVFAQITAESPYNLRVAATPPLKIAPSHGDLDPSNTWFLGPTRDHVANGTTFGSAAVAGHTVVTDRRTDHATPSVNNRPHIRSTAMWPNNDIDGRMLAARKTRRM